MDDIPGKKMKPRVKLIKFRLDVEEEEASDSSKIVFAAAILVRESLKVDDVDGSLNESRR